MSAQQTTILYEAIIEIIHFLKVPACRKIINIIQNIDLNLQQFEIFVRSTYSTIYKGQLFFGHVVLGLLAESPLKIQETDRTLGYYNLQPF